MASGANLTVLAKDYDCSICLDQLQNPKTLQCQHSFCKDCLDGVLKFNENGSATLQCPMKCYDVKVLTESETTNNLTANYHMKKTLDVIKQKSERQNETKCSQIDSCNRSICKWCVICVMALCEKCWHEHLWKHTQSTYIDIRYNEKEENTVPYCVQHSTASNFVCFDCSDCFICLYCKFRDHKGHRIESVDRAAKLVKLWAKTEKEKIHADYDEMEMLKMKYTTAFNDIESFRKDLVDELNNRMKKCITEYFEILQDEKKIILKKFDNMAQEFETETLYADFANCSINDKYLSSTYLDDLQMKLPFQIMLERTKIQQKMSALNIPKSRNLPAFSAVLQDRKFTILSDANHLGNLITHKENNLRSDFPAFNSDYVIEDSVDYKPLINELCTDSQFVNEFEEAAKRKTRECVGFRLNPKAKEWSPS